MLAKLAPYQLAAVLNPWPHFAFCGGVASGKTFTGSHWVIRMLYEFPGKTGLVAANTYDQLSGATIRELLNWLAEYDIEHVIDKMPPRSWGEPRKFKTYNNVISCRYRVAGVVHVSYIFTRVLSEPNNLRGITITWAWFDELAFAPKMAHDIALSRLRESKIHRTLATTTTNGENWFHARYLKGKPALYGTMHVPTVWSVEAGIISQEFYDTLLGSYSELMAQQELHAKYVNVTGGRAYYASGEWNRSRVAPWGDEYPDLDRPLIVCCDFNYSPAPHVWVVGQLSPDEDAIHWFCELSGVEQSTPDQAARLAGQYGDFFLRIFGDASGGRGTSSNEGKSDFDQIANTLNERGVLFSLDYDQANPRVKDRVEQVNMLAKDGLGRVRMTYNSEACPLLDGDMKSVGWGPNGKLSSGGDVQRTHASDAVGYGIYKLFPPNRDVAVTIGANVAGAQYRPDV
jgi:hypothetical protein